MERRLGLRSPAVGQVARHVEERVGSVVEGAAHVELVGLEALQPDPLDQAGRHGGAGQHRGDLAPQGGGQHRPDVDGGEPEPHVAAGAVDPGHVAVAPGDEPVQVVGQVRWRR